MSNVRPIHYTVFIEPDLEKFVFSGVVNINLEALDSVERIDLHALELTVESCGLNIAGKKEDCAFAIDAEKELLHVQLPEKRQGMVSLEIIYQGIINDKMAGFYRSKYTFEGKTMPLGVTQFQESDARRAFPCIDHPKAKATFDIQMAIDQGLVAISNQIIEKSETRPDGKRIIHFKRTPKMSTYLVFWSVGRFEFISDPEDRRARVAYLPGMEPYTAFGLDFGKKSLQYCENYYGVPYPLSKVDFIAVPDFAFGAMENWGAITFRENLLLYYPGITSKAGKERIAEVIAHEMAHQWFGNLVTPEDWKYLWLNESFATYFGFGVVDHYYPEWDIWSQFLYSQTGSALARDAHLQTIPIEIPGGEHVVINTSTAPIIYCKGGSILRQIKGYIGEDGFKQGVHHFLTRHAYQCASSSDLWQSFETVSNKPVTRMIQSWIEQPGYPMVEVKREGTELILTQERFSYLPEPSDQIWQIPINISIRDDQYKWRRIDFLLNEKTAKVDLGSDARLYKINDKQTGFFRTKYTDVENLEALGQAVLDQTLAPEDRWGLQSDLYALVENGEQEITAYLDFLVHYQNETAYLPLISITDNLMQAYLVLESSYQSKIAAVGCLLIENALSTIGNTPQATEGHTTSILRDRLIWQAVFWDSKKISSWAQSEFKNLQHGTNLPADITKSIMQAGAKAGNPDTFDWFIDRLEASESEHERTNILNALGCFTDQTALDKLKTYVLNSVPARNQSIPIAALAMNPAAIPGLWDWYTREQKAFSKFHPLIHERVILGIIPLSLLYQTGKPEDEPHMEATATAADVKAYFKAAPFKVNEDVLQLIMEKLEINCRMRAGHQS